MERTEQMLRWLYAGRMVVAAAVLVAALARWTVAGVDPLVVPATFAAAVLVTGAGLWWVEVLKRPAGRSFLYGQVLFDVLLVTAVVHVTGGSESPFTPLYILVITAGALLLPLPGGMLIGVLASLLFLADVLFLQDGDATRTDFLRIGLFCVLAVVTAWLGDRLRRTGSALGAVELELRQLRLDTNDILAAIDTALVTVDGAGRLMYLNEAAADLLSLPSADWSGRAVLEQLDRSAPGLGTLMRRTAATRVPVGRFEIRRRDAHGDRFLSVRTTVLDRDGVVTAVLQDITESKRIDELIRRAERLQAVAELGASLAHEIRNPLASIRSAVEQLTGDRLNRGDRDVLRRLVVTESERLSRLLTEFMEFSRVEMRRWAKLDLGVLASNAIDLVSRHPDRPERTRIELLRPTDSFLVDGDHDLLHRAVFNLVLNAVQHTREAGTVTVSLDRPVGNLPPGVDVVAPVRLAVRDQGPGVREEDLARVFDPFFTTRNGGTGLGLALVHRAVEAHRGAILVESAQGGGACFTIYLPAHAGGKPNDATPPE